MALDYGFNKKDNSNEKRFSFLTDRFPVKLREKNVTFLIIETRWN